MEYNEIYKKMGEMGVSAGYFLRDSFTRRNLIRGAGLSALVWVLGENIAPAVVAYADKILGR